MFESFFGQHQHRTPLCIVCSMRRTHNFKKWNCPLFFRWNMYSHFMESAATPDSKIAGMSINNLSFPNCLLIFYLIVGEDRAIFTCIIFSHHTMTAIDQDPQYISFPSRDKYFLPCNRTSEESIVPNFIITGGPQTIAGLPLGFISIFSRSFVTRQHSSFQSSPSGTWSTARMNLTLIHIFSMSVASSLKIQSFGVLAPR